MSNKDDEFVKIYNNFHNESPFSIRSGDIQETNKISLKKCVDFENKNFVGISIEIGAAFDFNGNLLLQKKGDKDQVKFTEDELKTINGSEIFTHNHIEDQSFSLDDIVSAVVLGVKEMRVISPSNIYSLKMSYNKRPTNLSQVNDFLKYLSSKFRKAREYIIKNLYSLSEKNSVESQRIEQLVNDSVIKTLQSDETFKRFFNIKYEVYKK